MKVKKYVADSMPEAMKKVRNELGHDAVILNSKEIETGGFFGFFTKKSIEVIAAIDTTLTVKKPEANRKVVKRTSEVQTNEQQKNLEIMNEIQQLKSLIQTMSNEKIESHQEYPEPFAKIDEQLNAHEVSPSLRLTAMKEALKRWYNLDDAQKNEELILQWIKEIFLEETSGIDMGGITFQKKFINIVGPTGVGKTTTIAKIAADSVLKKQKKVALITTDTYRIAAVEQLRTYAKILNIPLEVVYSVDDFKKAKELFAHYDLVLVDSAGRNFRNKLYVEELKKVIDFNDEVETFLVLSLTSKYRDMEAIYEQFSLIDIQKLIFTKKDETSYYGAMLNMVTKYRIGIAYITTGQNVPDDIIEGSSERMIEMIVESDSNE